MRVESVYDPEIVSYAGAIGLLQIMPRTGRLIAHRLGLTDFRTDDLLDPATNIELAAWYLRSLLDRFEGRLPLAIAAYNGGPHNVRRWMEEHGENLPLDAFLERIPFDQTFRYVRRVLSHYVAYRAQEGLGPPELDTTLPPRATDTVAF
jgi:soluble lytic murein transglycosylase